MTTTETKKPDASDSSVFAGSVPAHMLAWENFPDCASRCQCVEMMGVGECEYVCPHKFDAEGNGLDLEAQNDLNEPRGNRA